ncbi:hypothetical protein RB195_009198 [Necator americanus]|uniref:Uncharacterized protein n=1 Tax=Necator americanus TaxID=51031 RepID=A0ABR1CTH5_NECAM
MPRFKDSRTWAKSKVFQSLTTLFLGILSQMKDMERGDASANPSLATQKQITMAPFGQNLVHLLHSTLCTPESNDVSEMCDSAVQRKVQTSDFQGNYTIMLMDARFSSEYSQLPEPNPWDLDQLLEGEQLANITRLTYEKYHVETIQDMERNPKFSIETMNVSELA